MAVATTARGLRVHGEWSALSVGLSLFALGMVATLRRDITDVQTAAFLCSLTVLCAIASYDVATLRAPNWLVSPGAAITTASWFSLNWSEAVGAVIAGTLAFVAVLLIVLAGRGRMGIGDAKVAFLCGAASGARGFVVMFGLSFAIGGLLAIAALALAIKGRRDSIAFTPFLVLGVTAAWFVKG